MDNQQIQEMSEELAYKIAIVSTLIAAFEIDNHNGDRLKEIANCVENQFYESSQIEIDLLMTKIRDGYVLARLKSASILLQFLIDKGLSKQALFVVASD